MSRPRPRQPRSLAQVAAALGLAAAASTCVIPDTVGVLDERLNRFAVKIVEPTVLTADAEAACPDGICPQPPGAAASVLPHFLDPNFTVMEGEGGQTRRIYNFCSCPEGQRDDNAQKSWALYVEDRDGAGDGEYDDIYVALLLDHHPTQPNPQNFVAYRNYIDPREPLDAPQPTSVTQYDPIDRPDPKLRAIQFGNNIEKFDFCNRSGMGNASLTPGYHTMRVVVTDRDWFGSRKATEDDTGETDTGDMTPGVVQEGVPDLAAGATFDAFTYVFHCQDSGAENSSCECLDVDEP